MGHKPSNNFQSDRPESGGADHDEQREKSGILEREKQEFAAAQKATRASPGRTPAHRTPEEVLARRAERQARRQGGARP